jgi:hypothetical protein
MCLALCASVRCQQTATPEEAIGRIINSGLLEGHDQKAIGGIGDAAAVLVTKVIGGSELSPRQIENILVVLNLAFGGVGTDVDREPRTALFVLRHLELSTSDSQLKSKIARTRNYIQEEVDKSKQRSG